MIVLIMFVDMRMYVTSISFHLMKLLACVLRVGAACCSISGILSLNIPIPTAFLSESILVVELLVQLLLSNDSQWIM